MATINPTGLYCAYLRKSRQDAELEAMGRGPMDTLVRHERQLRDLAARFGIRVAQWYREVVSGDTIADRPQVQQLLRDVNDGMWDGVLVMDVDRFGRGDSVDQGLIMQSLSYAGALVITPDKTYDPADDSDAEFFELKLFFARREYKLINKRLQRGRLASVMEGSYIAAMPPYGYKKEHLAGRKFGWTLVPVPEQAEIVRAIFDWYANGMDGRSVGAKAIVARLNRMGVRTNTGIPFSDNSVRKMLQNPVYVGKVRWSTRRTVTRIVDGKRVKTRERSDNPILVDGIHDAVIDDVTWSRVQAIFAAHAKRPVNDGKTVTNIFAGLVRCDQCGHLMQRNTQKKSGGSGLAFDLLACVTVNCPTCSAPISVIESTVLDVLRRWSIDFDRLPAPQLPVPVDAEQAARTQIEAKRTTLNAQLSRQYDLLEQGVYSMDEFRARRADITAQIARLDTSLADLSAVPKPDRRRALVPKIRTVLAAYDTATPAEKNALLHSVIDHIEYHKLQRCRRNNAPGDYLSLSVYPLIPSD